MANISSFEFNSSAPPILGTSIAVVTGIFVPLVIAVAAVDIFVIVALIANAQLNRTVRFILINLLLSSIVAAVASIIFHSFVGAYEWGTLVDLQVYTGLCQSATFLLLFGGAGRFLFTTLYATTVFMLVRFWNKPTIEPRNTKYFIVTAAIIWIATALAATPVISRELVASICVPNIGQLDIGFVSYFASYIVVFLLLPAVLSFILLIVSGCYLIRVKANSSGTRKISKSMLKFGLFLLLGQGFNIAGQIILPVLGLTTAVLTEGFPAVLLNACIFDLSLIPTPILITLFFTSLRKKVEMWTFCRCHYQPTPSRASTDSGS